MTVPSVSMKSDLGMAHPAPVNGGDLALGPDHVTLRHLSILLILLWLRRRTCCSASVPVAGGSVSAELLHRQLDLVTGIAALLAVDMRERAPFARALGIVAGQDPSLASCGEVIVPKPAVHATRLGISAKHLPAARCPTATFPKSQQAPPATEVEALRSYVSVPAASDIP